MHRIVAVILLVGSFAAPTSSFAQDGGADDESASQAETSEKDATEGDTSDKGVDSPCGNPRWAELPEQHEVDGDLPPDARGGSNDGDESSSSSDETSDSSDSTSSDGAGEESDDSDD